MEKKNISITEIRKIDKAKMKDYLTTLERFKMWKEITTEKVFVEDGGKNKTGVRRKRTFPAARLAFFKMYYNVIDESEPRDFELEAARWLEEAIRNGIA